MHVFIIVDMQILNYILVNILKLTEIIKYRMLS